MDGDRLDLGFPDGDRGSIHLIEFANEEYPLFGSGTCFCISSLVRGSLPAIAWFIVGAGRTADSDEAVESFGVCGDQQIRGDRAFAEVQDIDSWRSGKMSEITAAASTAN